MKNNIKDFFPALLITLSLFACSSEVEEEIVQRPTIEIDGVSYDSGGSYMNSGAECFAIGNFGGDEYFIIGTENVNRDDYMDALGNYYLQGSLYVPCEKLDFSRDWYITVNGEQYCFKEKYDDEHERKPGIYLIPFDNSGTAFIELDGGPLTIETVDSDRNGWDEIFIGMYPGVTDKMIDPYYNEERHIPSKYYGTFFPVTVGEWIPGDGSQVIAVYYQTTDKWTGSQKPHAALATMKHTGKGDWRIIYLEGLELHEEGYSEFHDYYNNPIVVSDINGDGKNEIVAIESSLTNGGVGKEIEPPIVVVYEIVEHEWYQPPNIMGAILDCEKDAQSCPSWDEQCCGITNVEDTGVCLALGCGYIGDSAIEINANDNCPKGMTHATVGMYHYCLVNCQGDGLAEYMDGCLDRGAKKKYHFDLNAGYIPYDIASGDLNQNGFAELYLVEYKPVNGTDSLYKARIVAAELTSSEAAIPDIIAKSDWLGQFKETVDIKVYKDRVYLLMPSQSSYEEHGGLKIKSWKPF